MCLWRLCIINRSYAELIKVLEKRYLQKDEEGRPVETLKSFSGGSQDCSCCRPYVREIRGRGDADRGRFLWDYHILISSKQPDVNERRQKAGTASACFVLPIEDSMESIFEA